MSTICPFIKLIHLSFHCNPAHSSQPANGTPNHVRVAAPFRLSDGLRSGEKTAGRSRRSCCVLHHRCVLSPCLWPLTARGKTEETWQSDVRMTKTEGGGRLNRGGEGKQVGERKHRTETKHRNKNIIKSGHVLISYPEATTKSTILKINQFLLEGQMCF